MSAFISAADPHAAPANSPRDGSAEGRVLQFPAYRSVEETLPFPQRGILLAGLVSGALWIALFLAARALWTFLR